VNVWEEIVARIERGDLVVCPACEGQGTRGRHCPTCGVSKGVCDWVRGKPTDNFGNHPERYCPTCDGASYVDQATAAAAMLTGDE
jgi:hypothetical protein